VYSAIYLWFFVPYGFVSLPFDSWRYIALNGVAINGVSYLFWIWSLKTIEGSKAGIYVLSVPVLSALWICLFLGAPFELSYFWALAALIVAGVLIVRA
jgi:drug/metabolite transporter (DMT)-like permease